MLLFPNHKNPVLLTISSTNSRLPHTSLNHSHLFSPLPNKNIFQIPPRLHIYSTDLPLFMNLRPYISLKNPDPQFLPLPPIQCLNSTTILPSNPHLLTKQPPPLLHLLRKNPHPNLYTDPRLRLPTRTSSSKALFCHIHNPSLPPPPSLHSIPPNPPGPLFPLHPTRYLPNSPNSFTPTMTIHKHRISSQTPDLPLSPLATKSPCRSTYFWLHNPCSHSPQTRRLRPNSYNPPSSLSPSPTTYPPFKNSPMRSPTHSPNLPSPN